MSNRLVTIVSAVVLCLVYMAQTRAADNRQAVTLTGDPWPPYIIGDLGGEAKSGVGVDLLNAIFERLYDIELSIPMVPWNRALQEVKRGKKDGIAILLKTPEREEYMDYTNEVFRSYSTVWYSANSFPEGFDWQNHADFKHYSIGGVRGHSYGNELDRMIGEGSLTVIEVSSPRQLFAMLAKGRIQLALADRLVGAYFAEEQAAAGARLQAVKKPVAVEIYYIAFSKKSQARHLIPALNQEISSLKREGVIQRLIGACSADSSLAANTQAPGGTLCSAVFDSTNSINKPAVSRGSK